MQTNVQQQNEQVYLISNYSASPATAAISVVVDHGRATAGQAPSIIGGILNRGPEGMLYLLGACLASFQLYLLQYTV